MDFRIQVPGLSYFSIYLVLEPSGIPSGVRDQCSQGGLRTFFSPVAIPGVPKSGGGDGFLFRQSKIPSLNVVQRWSPFASASGSVTLS